jgi:NhaP-type Na+/H+ or K+/H+ antiporter
MLELAGIIILGIIAQWVAWRLKVPAILPLILTGLLVGPIATLFTKDGTKLIEPIWDNASGHGLFPGESLFYFVSLAIGIILFEGGLTLRRNEIKGVGPVILKLITLGSAVTFVGGTIASHYIIGLSWTLSALFAGLIIVTGPTVIAPILRNIPLKPNISTVLKWEGILIDPLGALVAVLVFEFINSGGEQFTQHALVAFGRILMVGFATGLIAAYGLFYLIKFKLIPHYLLNVFTLALVLGVFVLADLLEHESGLLAVVTMGMVLGNLNVPNLKEILNFKESLSVLLISVLFILLSANINMADLELLYNWRSLALFLSVILILRPLGVFLSTRGSALKFNEKLFISWVGPRGIVAAGIASLFGIKLTMQGVPGAQYITPLVFLIVLGTVLLNATTARFIARILKVLLEKSSGILIVGANQAGILLGKYLKSQDKRVVLLDSNSNNVDRARNEGLEAINESVYSDTIEDNIELSDIGFLMALTGSADVNTYVGNKFGDIFGENGTYRLLSIQEIKDTNLTPEGGLFDPKIDYINLMEVVRDYPDFHEVELKDKAMFDQWISQLNSKSSSVPIFIKDPEGVITIIPAKSQNIEIKENSKLIYLGKEYH